MKFWLLFPLVSLTLFAMAACKAEPTNHTQGEYKTSSDWETIWPGGNTVCSDGSPYTFHIRKGLPDKVLLFMNGGGACWDDKTCNIQADTPTYVPRADMDHNHPNNHGGIFNLEHPDNPVKDWTLVFASYCTGDVHLGDRAVTYKAANGETFDIQHKGAVNIDSVLDWIEAQTTPQTVVVSGASAGAIAAPVYAGQLARTFPDTNVFHLADGAAGYQSPIVPAILAQWNVFAALDPQIYAQLDPKTAGFYSFYAVENMANPDINFAMFDTTNDAIQVMFMRLTGDSGALVDALVTTYDDVGNKVQNFSSYLAPGNDHTILRFDRLYTTQVGGTLFLDWFEDLIVGTVPPKVDCRQTNAPLCDGAAP